VLRNSIFRSAYELLFTPVPPAGQRATKLLVDAGATRLGDMAGAALIQVLLLLAGAWAGGLALVATIGTALVTLIVARRLHRGYTAALARSLTAPADRLPDDGGESTALLQTVGGFDLGQLRVPMERAPAPGAAAPEAVGRAEALASRDTQVVLAARGEGSLPQALADRRFEVRYLAGRALFRQSVAQQGLMVDRERILAAVRTEVTVGRGVWQRRRLIDDADDASAPMETALIRDRADRSLEQVFTLLALILPREPLRLAHHCLHTADCHLRGTALEYLESALPSEVRERLWLFLEPEGLDAVSERRGPDEALARLLQSRESIVLALAAAWGRQRE
jgi:hypothetical protein